MTRVNDDDLEAMHGLFEALFRMGVINWHTMHVVGTKLGDRWMGIEGRDPLRHIRSHKRMDEIIRKRLKNTP